MLDLTINEKGLKNNIERAKAQNIILPTIEQQMHPEKVPEKILEKLNPKAIEVYSRQNIDLYTQMLRIAVCAQHNNGGVYTDNNYETNIKGLYVIGEAAGTFGLARPGGTALNDTQVSGLLCAKHIKNKASVSADCCMNTDEKYRLISENFEIDSSVNYSDIKKMMSDSSAFLRNKEECESLLAMINGILSDLPLRHKSLSDYFYDRDMLISAKALLETVIAEMSLTGSRGGAVFISDGKIIPEDLSYRKYLTVTENGKVYFEKTKPVPKSDEPFEKYLKNI